jgi:prophage regulatory protein
VNLCIEEGLIMNKNIALPKSNSGFSPENPIQILRIDDIKSQIGLSRSAIYDRLNPHSPRFDVTFPKQVHLGGRAVGFIASEVSAWLQSRIDFSRRAKGGQNV